MKILGTCLMLSLLVGVFTPAAPSRAAALLTDPIPWLSGSTVADAPHTSTASGVDGAISPGEYASAHRLAYRVNGGVMEVYIQQNSSSLMIAMDCPDQSPYIFRTGGVGPALQVFLDTDDDGASLPQPDDFLFTVSKGNTTSVRIGDGSYWISAANDDWLGAATTTPTGWQAEFSIPFTKLGILSPSSEVLGFAVAEVWTTTWPYDWYWPASAFFDNPSSWGTLISTSHWSSFYWKSASWQDYAPGGMPDFDQKQLNWIVESPSGLIWTHSAPAAAANSLWWFDSRFEAAAKAPPLLSDTYRLFKTYYPTLDDHDYPNASALIIDLAENYLNTNKLAAGTSVTDLFEGLRAFLKKTSLYDSYRVSLAKKPGFGWVANEIKRSEDVILLLGFWQEDGHGSFVRVGGHYVTAAGVDLENQKIAFSDPFLDATEEGLTGGEVGSGWLLPHSPIPGHSADLHNDAGNLSHDIYEIEQAVAPSGFWSPANYYIKDMSSLMGANPHPDYTMSAFNPELKVQTVVEFAVVVSPFNWKAGGRWNSSAGSWEPFKDYAISGMPDISQKQDGWKFPTINTWSFCGPAAAANAMWWFDSKYEPVPQHLPTVSDHYPLISSYAVLPDVWDDHEPANVDDASSAWPPGNELVERLAMTFMTDLGSPGTQVANLASGVVNWISGAGLDYQVEKLDYPTFWAVAGQVERSRGVILLLGFYEENGGVYKRLGGHYVTAAGVDQQGGFIALSDPWFDRIEATWPYAGLAEAPDTPVYFGRRDDGLVLHHVAHDQAEPDLIHNDAGNISHDIYRVTTVSGTAGFWGPEKYATTWEQVANFLNQNGSGNTFSGGNLVTLVEAAVVIWPTPRTTYIPAILK